MVKRILILTTPFRPNVGGVETHLDDLIYEAGKLGYQFDVLTYQPLISRAWGKTVETGNNYRVYRLPWLRFNLFLVLEKYPLLEFIYLFPGLFFITLLFLIFKNSSIQTIHAQGLIAGAIGTLLGKVFNIPVIISTHSIYHFPKDGWYSKFVKYLFNGSKQVLTLSNQSRQEVVELGIAPNRVSVFTYWVNQNIFKPFNKEDSIKKLKLPVGFLVLFVGRLVEVKGINELMSAAANLPSIKFLIVGDGPLAPQIKGYSQNFPNIFFLGKVNNKDLPKIYSGVDVLIVPSTHEEGYGRVILEALSCGLPVIGSNRGGIKEALNQKIGLLIEVSPGNIATAINHLKSHPNQLNQMRKEATKYAREQFSKENVKMITKYYE